MSKSNKYADLTTLKNVCMIRTYAKLYSTFV